tara:strand:- start:1633 stop:2316 length:684 start_codon:yes stop_codon:yes gene_type:complete
MTFEEFVKKYNIVDPYSNIYPDTKYDYVSAWKAGVAPKLIDGELKWPSEFKHDDSPERYINGFDTKNFKERIKMSYKDNKGNQFYNGPTDADTYQKPLTGDEIADMFHSLGVNVDRSVFSEHGHSEINKLINTNIEANALMETMKAYKNPSAILKDDSWRSYKGKDTLLQDVFDLLLESETKGLGDRFPTYQQTGGTTGGLINSLLRGLTTGSYERKKSPYLLDESK